ncbi:MAG: hypothetical protein HYR73_04305 [Candidatus Eisenbacteria bacterium]|nr:hypothetical protein [Candidatus Eisenbacteria bacterium]
MDTRYSVVWLRSNGQRVAIERMLDSELKSALRMLEREEASDPIAASLYDAVSEEIEARGVATIGTVERKAA